MEVEKYKALKHIVNNLLENNNRNIMLKNEIYDFVFRKNDDEFKLYLDMSENSIQIPRFIRITNSVFGIGVFPLEIPENLSFTGNYIILPIPSYIIRNLLIWPASAPLWLQEKIVNVITPIQDVINSEKNVVIVNNQLIIKNKFWNDGFQKYILTEHTGQKVGDRFNTIFRKENHIIFDSEIINLNSYSEVKPQFYTLWLDVIKDIFRDFNLEFVKKNSGEVFLNSFTPKEITYTLPRK
jgi:hypothetical protein